MKALEILLEYKASCKQLISEGHYGSIIRLKELDEAIAELEELMKPKTCDGCKYYQELKQGKAETICCTLYLDCVRKHMPRDRYEQKESK